MSNLARLILLVACMGASVVSAAKPKFDPLNPPPSVVPAKPVAPVAASQPAPKPVATPARPVPAAPVAPAAASTAANAKPAFDPLHATGPRVVPFEELENYLGRSILIKTNLRTTRKGVLKRFNRAGLVIEDMSRGFSMNIDIPRSTVSQVQVLD